MSTRDLSISRNTLLATCAFALMAAPASASETKGFVVNMYAKTFSLQEGDCPPVEEMPGAEGYVRAALERAGKSKAEIDKELKDGVGKFLAQEQIYKRGVTADGKPGAAYTYPATVPNPQLPPQTKGKYAYGFNLDGKGAASPGSFEHPVTHEKGINNQVARALGCLSIQRATMPTRPIQDERTWDMARDVTPAWLIEITGIDDYTNDPEVTVGFYKATTPATRNNRGSTQANVSFGVDPAPQYHNIAKARIRDGVLEEIEPFSLVLPGNPMAISEANFRHTRMSFKFTADGGLDGIVGGYQTWFPIYQKWAISGGNSEAFGGMDTVGVFHALQNVAEDDPDPVTGKNRRISAAVAIDAVPAFVVHPPVQQASKHAQK